MAHILKVTSLFTCTLALVMCFQNCGKPGMSSATVGDQVASGQKTERVIDTASQFNKVVYDPGLEYAYGPSGSRVEIDVDQGSVAIGSSGAPPTEHCTLDADRLDSLEEILSISKICEPGPMPPGTVSCMAAGVADIELSSDSSTNSVKLRPLVCNSGVFLCDGNDQVLRALLADLKANPPAGCK